MIRSGESEEVLAHKTSGINTGTSQSAIMQYEIYCYYDESAFKVMIKVIFMIRKNV